MEYPRHLFKYPGSYGEGARSYKVAGAADEAEEAELVEQGWHLTKEAAWGLGAPKPEVPAPKEEAAPSLLDGNAEEVSAALPSLPLDELEALKLAETEGKNRKGVLAAIDAAIDAALAKDGNGD